jgi:hypothetical protein
MKNRKTCVMRADRLLLSGAVLLGAVAGCDVSAPPLKLDISHDSAALLVRNRDTELLSNCRIVLNDSWAVTGVRLRPGVTEHIAADRFGISGGRQLDELGSRLTVSVNCHEPQFRSGTFALGR